MGEPTSAQDAATLIAEVDRTRRRLYALLRANDTPALWKRPPSGAWSIAENVRHLVFAEQAHLGKFLPDGAAWNPMKLHKRRKTLTVKGEVVRLIYQERQLVVETPGAKPGRDLEEVLASWDLIHRPIRTALKSPQDGAEYALQRHIQHLNAHVHRIEKQLRGSGNKA